jgi:hypothetical protein
MVKMKFFCLICGKISQNESKKKENVCKDCADEEDSKGPSSEEMGLFWSISKYKFHTFQIDIRATKASTRAIGLALAKFSLLRSVNDVEI